MPEKMTRYSSGPPAYTSWEEGKGIRVKLFGSAEVLEEASSVCMLSMYHFVCLQVFAGAGACQYIDAGFHTLRF